MSSYIALTGGIGSGKSVVANVFRCLGVPVYDSDSRAKMLMNSDSVIKQCLQDLLGPQVYKDSTLQKDVVAQAIFGNADICRMVNEIVHPRVWLDYKQWSDSMRCPFTIMETALLYETDLYKNFHKSIVVAAEERIRIARVMKRDGFDANKVFERIKNQPSYEKALQKADFIIENNDTFVIPQVIEVYNTIIGN